LKPPFYFFSTKGKKCYTEIAFEKGAQLIFGSETAGLPPWIHETQGELLYSIPMRSEVRSLNLSNAVAIVLYEALR
jgi:tRNA (cytidine/uridine-2'-O-)-methyltransferase